jgi:hypothetical protein
MGRNRTLKDSADIIERFLEGKSLYPQEWNDFVDMSQRDEKVEVFRRRCSELDPLVNRAGGWPQFRSHLNLILNYLLTLTLSEGGPCSSLPDFREGERGDPRSCLDDYFFLTLRLAPAQTHSAPAPSPATRIAGNN